MGIFIDDGYTLRKQVPAEPGIHDEAEVVYRPALARVRAEYGTLAAGRDHNRVHDFENDLIARHVVEIDGQKLPADRAARLVPNLRGKVLDLVLGYAGSDDEARDAKN